MGRINHFIAIAVVVILVSGLISFGFSYDAFAAKNTKKILIQALDSSGIPIEGAQCYILDLEDSTDKRGIAKFEVSAEFESLLFVTCLFGDPISLLGVENPQNGIPLKDKGTTIIAVTMMPFP